MVTMNMLGIFTFSSLSCVIYYLSTNSTTFSVFENTKMVSSVGKFPSTLYIAFNIIYSVE